MSRQGDHVLCAPGRHRTPEEISLGQLESDFVTGLSLGRRFDALSQGHNAEFAHQLDGESGAVEGAPALERRSQYIAWARVLEREYRSLIDDLRNNRPTLLSAYGATSPAEFFAVLTEAFFERSRELKWRHPELYQQLASFYKQDPATLRACFESGPGAIASPAA